MRPDWWFNRGCLFDLGGWILDFQDQRTPKEYLEDMANGFHKSKHSYDSRKKEVGSSEDDCDPAEDDLGEADNTESALIFENGIGKRYKIR